jgi:hypothetical protein
MRDGGVGEIGEDYYCEERSDVAMVRFVIMY